jgi:hypothetical protein
MDNQQIELRGYLYRDSEGNVVLTDTPNLKSCCVGKPEVSKIYLAGSFPEKLPVQLSIVRGTLQGENLLEAELVSSSGSGASLIIAGLFLAVITAYFLKKRRG